MTEAWHVVQTIGGREELVESELKRRKVPPFYPVEQRTRFHARKKETVKRPLYPTYVFALFDGHDLAWQELLTVPGVFTILGVIRPSGRPHNFADKNGSAWQPYRGQPIALPDDVVPYIKSRLRDGVYIVEEEEPEQLEHLKPDTPVMVLGGAFDQWQGLVDVQVEQRVRVLLDIFGRKTPIIVERDSVAVVMRS